MNKMRCEIVVPDRTYRRAGQCEKRLGVKIIMLDDTPAKLCQHHRAALERGRVMERAR